ncbi:flagellar basal-body rod protein FlgB [Alkaliphilus metalliredigens QYMF]|uniref:Flagellar basal body rod protein FlgB n=1 Tax=Alkaliphilus metalliredigens (strain QYMF) TaxID=293826 RepID=A6TRR2_ALKMQ|nr:flagellar basal body rod protein FlgB [Alkaliphilus metalliredigens]ABR48880.1 flagellar basal-body rod protein FlgB [Alkaliphilus metalliredigens QYMF]
MTNGLYSNINLLNSAMSASWVRNEAISNNIANANTPNFKKSTVEFETHLKNALQGNSVSGERTHVKHIAIGAERVEEVKYKVRSHEGYRTRRDGNNVDIDVEMAELAKNQVIFNTLSTQINNEFRRIKTAINEGRG